jgi:hypothetical protein
LYEDSKHKKERADTIRKKHKLADLTSLSNDRGILILAYLLDGRNKFFIPKINDFSRKMVSRKINKSGALSMSKTQDLYQDALQRQKHNDDSRNQNKLKEMENKQIMSVKSRKILYEHFISKFNDICERCGVQDKVEYDQYLRIVKHIVFWDQIEESKISEFKEAFEGWKSMKGDMNGYVIKKDLKQFLLKVLDLHPIHHASKQEKTIVGDKTIGRSTIDLMKVNEDEVRLDLIDNHPASMLKIQSVYKSIKGTWAPGQINIKKSVKNFFTSKHKESQHKASKSKSKDRSRDKKLVKSKISKYNL